MSLPPCAGKVRLPALSIYAPQLEVKAVDVFAKGCALKLQARCLHRRPQSRGAAVGIALLPAEVAWCGMLDGQGSVPSPAGSRPTLGGRAGPLNAPPAACSGHGTE